MTQTRTITASELDAMPYQVLIDLKEETLVASARIELQIEEAGTIPKASRTSQGNNWYFQAKYALKMRKVLLQSIAHRLPKARKAEESQRKKPFELAFMDAAHDNLDPILFQRLKSIAHAAVELI